jgi:hypothetical protein
MLSYVAQDITGPNRTHKMKEAQHFDRSSNKKKKKKTLLREQQRSA